MTCWNRKSKRLVKSGKEGQEWLTCQDCGATITNIGQPHKKLPEPEPEKATA